MPEMPEDPNPAELVLKVVRGCDKVVPVERHELLPDGSAGDPVDFDEGETAFLNVDLAPPVRVEGVISGSVATFTIPAEVCDQIRNRTTWQAALDDGVKTPLVVGCFERHDGKGACS